MTSMQDRLRAAGRFLLILTAPLSLAAAPAPPESRLLLRTGDPAPAQARVADSFSGELAELPDGSLVFRAGDDSLEVLEAGRVRILLHVGERIDGCGTVSHIYQFSAGGDGSVAVLVECFAIQAIARLDPAGGPAEVVLRTGMPFSIAGTPVTIGRVRGTALDGQGRLVAAIDDGPGFEAIVRQSPGGVPETLIETGDPLGPGLFTGAVREPAVSASGLVAFSATTSLSTDVIATLVPGGAPTVLFSVPGSGSPGAAPGPLGLAPPAVNDSGAVGFLWGDPASIRVQRAGPGGVLTVAAAGDGAPGGGSFSEINWVYPAIDAAGGVIFGARLSSGLTGLYRSDGQATRVAEQGDATGNGEELTSVGDWSFTPLVSRDGAVRFTAVDTAGAGLFASHGGVVAVDLRAGTPLDEPARFIRLDVSTSFLLPHQSAGPFMAADGGVIFDAVTTGRGRGLFIRAADGTLTAVALDRDPAPGGGHFDGSLFTYASIAPGGLVAFLGAAPDSVRGSTLQLFAGVPGTTLERIVGGGDLIPGYDAPISALLPPSRIDGQGVVAVPAVLADGRMLLLVRDGGGLRVFAATGDTLPGGETIAALRTGQPGLLLSPLLEDAGTLLFGVVSASGHPALYRAPLAGGLSSASRALGEGDLVQGGTLLPFRIQALAADHAGRLAFQAVPSTAPEVQTYSADVGPVPRLVMVPEDPNRPPPPPGTTPRANQALARLAATDGGGVVHEMFGSTRGRRLLFATPRVPPNPDPDQAYDHQELVGPFVASPDGGQFLRSFAATPPGSTGVQRAPMRLGGDGDRFAVAVEPTSEGPEILVLFDLRPNLPPIAAAGPDQILECTGPGGAAVTLDAGATSDPDDDPLEYIWTGPFGTATGPSATVTIPLGTFTITLTVRDPAGGESVDEVVVTVRDTVAPSIAVRALPDRLWPPDNRLALVAFVVTTGDRCDPGPGVALVSITSNDPKFDPAADVANATYDADDRLLSLRAARTGGIGGRLYTVVYRATDASGNAADGSAGVLVPQSQGK